MPAVRQAPAVSSSADGANAVSGSPSASRTLRESEAQRDPMLNQRRQRTVGSAVLVFCDVLAAPVAETARGAVLSRRLTLQIADSRMNRARVLAGRSGRCGSPDAKWPPLKAR